MAGRVVLDGRLWQLLLLLRIPVALAVLLVRLQVVCPTVRHLACSVPMHASARDSFWVTPSAPSVGRAWSLHLPLALTSPALATCSAPSPHCC